MSLTSLKSFLFDGMAGIPATHLPAWSDIDDGEPDRPVLLLLPSALWPRDSSFVTDIQLGRADFKVF